MIIGTKTELPDHNEVRGSERSFYCFLSSMRTGCHLSGSRLQTLLLFTYPRSNSTIDRVTKVERAASTKVGGCGIRYTVMVEGLPRFLYDEEGKWFMEDEVLIEVTE